MALINNIIQIEEFELTPGLTDIIYSTSGPLPNALIGIYCDKYGVYPADMKKEGNSIHVTYEAQSETIHVALIFIMGGLSIVNHLTSTSETDALSAAQGKALKDLIDAMASPALSDLTDVDLDSLTADDILIYDGVSEKWINTSFPSIPSNIDDLQDVSITSPSDGQVLLYDDGEWVNGSVSGGINYSETEQDTGLKWIDGSAIYQRTFVVSKSDLTSQGNNNYKYTASIAFNRIIAFKNVIQYNNSFATLPSGTTNTAYTNYINVIDSSGITFTLGASMYNILNDIAVTIEYTKT